MRIGALAIGALLAMHAMWPAQAAANEVDALRSELEHLRGELAAQEQSAQRRRDDETRQHRQLVESIQRLEQQVQRLSAAPPAVVADPVADRAKAMELAVLQAQRRGSIPPRTLPGTSAAGAAVVGKDRPDVLDKMLQKAGIELPARDADVSDAHRALRRKTASGHYANPSSFFLLHGSTTITYADFQSGLGTAPETVPQILISGTSTRSGKHEAGFRNDNCLFIGSELTEDLKAVMELHMVGNSLNPVLTEAKMSWEPFDTGPSAPSLRFVGGRYWWPFGIHDIEWFSAANAFNLISPAAAEVVPPHWNELGVMAEGEWPMGQHAGVNYLASLGNGVTGFDLDDNVGMARTNQFDQDSDLNFTTRVGVIPGIENMEIGGSFSVGGLRRGQDTSYAASDARRYVADLEAYGVDLTYHLADLSMRGYWYFSEEDLDEAGSNKLERNGGTLDVLYTVLHNAPILREVALKGRIATAEDATLAAGTFRRNQYGFGVNARPHEHFLLKAEYFVQDESHIDDIQDNGFTLSGTVEF